MKTSLITENHAFLNNLFSQFSPVLLKVEFVGDISVFAFTFDNESDLSDNWKKITSSVAACYQSAFEGEQNDFERWNIYILFLVKTPVGSQLKYRIESDKFSSRKIIHENATTKLSMDDLQALIDKYVIDNDIDIAEQSTSLPSKNAYDKANESKIYRLIDNCRLKTAGPTNDSEAIEDIYQQILKEINDEIQKS